MCPESVPCADQEVSPRAAVLEAIQVLEEILDAAPLGMALLDEALRVLRANPEFCRILGCDAAALADRPVSESSPEVCGPDFEAAARAVLAGGPAVHGTQLVCGAAPDARHVQLACYPVRVGDRLTGAGVVLEDVTERRRAEEMHQRLLAIASHDLKTPVTAIGLSAQRLVGALAGRERGIASGILASAKRVQGIVRELVDFAVIERRGAPPIRPAPARIDRLCRLVADECVAAWPGRRVECRGEGDPAGEWDADRLAQAISNLLSNALRYGDPGAAVELTWDGTAVDRVHVRVANAGPPIPEGTLPELFEAFRRGPGEQRGHGLGLGLYIARRIALAHGGELGGASSGGKTVFSVAVPRRASPAPSQ
jgi:PAS domain S-box-containing protein